MNELIMQIILGCASIVITACITYATQKVTAWLTDKKLLDDVTKAVNYAEQLCKTSKITKDERKVTALKFLSDKGIKIPIEVADMLIESVIGGINTALKKEAVDEEDNSINTSNC
ncbi:MAG: phage holin family protein [Porphyromonadaceae bacterium]|nr:phage holin family protein [Porphyromonadaceae bacterium]